MRPGWPLLLLAALAAALVLLARPRPDAPARIATAAQPTSSLPANPPPTTAYAVLHARVLDVALDRHAAAASEPERRRLRAEVDAACRAPVLLRLDGRSEADPRRDPARRELEHRCAALPVPSMYVPVAETDLPDEDAIDPELGQAALAALREAADAEQIAAAWMLAYRHDALPQDAIFPDRRRLLPSEAEALIRVVLDWRECARLAACDADSLFALRVCALHGCAPGSDVHAAWHQALAPRDYESALAIHAWLQRQWPPLAAR